MTSPLVQRLSEAIQQDRNPESRACLMAELGCYWARVGEFDRAEALRSELRQSYGDGRNVRVSILIMCIEALLAYFRELSPQARDRMARAALLSTAVRDSDLIALTSAWMAHIDFNLNRFESMATSIDTCLSHLDENNFPARCRISLVLGDAFLFSGETTSSDFWYQRARAAAAKIGDQAAIGALTYNRAALHVAAARFQNLIRPLPVADVNLLNVEVQSAINYQVIAQLRSLDHLLQSARIGVLMLQDKFIELLPLITTVLESPDVPQGSAQRILLEADLAVSRANSGLIENALLDIERLHSDSIDQFSAEDRALIWSSALRASRACGDSRYIDYFEAKISLAIEEHSNNIATLRSLLAPFDSSQSSNYLNTKQ